MELSLEPLPSTRRCGFGAEVLGFDLLSLLDSDAKETSSQIVSALATHGFLLFRDQVQALMDFATI